jgi:hypothetical protein
MAKPVPWQISGEPVLYFTGWTADIGAGSETAVPLAHFLSRMKVMLNGQKQITIRPFAQGINRRHARVFR